MKFFFNNTLRSYDVAIGQLFNDIWVIKYDKVKKELISELRVPLVYAPKLHWYLRKYDNIPNDFNVKTTIPKISFSRGAPQYDAKRQMSKYVQIKGNKRYSSVVQNYIQKWAGSSVPYKIPYEFSIWTKNINEMNQILEQILSLFNTQSYNIFVNEVPLLDVGRNCRLIMENSTQNYQTEFDIKGDRLLRYSFTLNLEGNIYPVIDEQQVIKEIIVNYWETEATEDKLLAQSVVVEDVNTEEGA